MGPYMSLLSSVCVFGGHLVCIVVFTSFYVWTRRLAIALVL